MGLDINSRHETQEERPANLKDATVNRDDTTIEHHEQTPQATPAHHQTIEIPTNAPPLNYHKAVLAVSQFCGDLEAFTQMFPAIGKHLNYADQFHIFQISNNELAFVSTTFYYNSDRIFNQAYFLIKRDNSGFQVEIVNQSERRIIPPRASNIVDIGSGATATRKATKNTLAA